MNHTTIKKQKDIFRNLAMSRLYIVFTLERKKAGCQFLKMAVMKQKKGTSYVSSKFSRKWHYLMKKCTQ